MLALAPVADALTDDTLSALYGVAVQRDRSGGRAPGVPGQALKTTRPVLATS